MESDTSISLNPEISLLSSDTDSDISLLSSDLDFSFLSSSFLSIESEDTCLLCCKSIKKTDVTKTIKEGGGDNLLETALPWSKVNIPVTDEKYLFTSVYTRAKKATKKIGKASCRLNFFMKCDKKYGELDERQSKVLDSDEKLNEGQTYDECPARSMCSLNDTISDDTCFI